LGKGRAHDALKQQSRRCRADGFALANNRADQEIPSGRDQESISLAGMASSFIVRHLKFKNRQVRVTFVRKFRENYAAFF
jgi:hypothetical protein